MRQSAIGSFGTSPPLDFSSCVRVFSYVFLVCVRVCVHVCVCID